MKLLKLVGGICYATSFFFAANLFFKFNIGLSIGTTLIIFLTLGGLGFLFNLISYTKDKTGVVFKMLGIPFTSILMMGFPLSKILIIVGSILLLYSLFQMRKRKIKKEDNEEILDQL